MILGWACIATAFALGLAGNFGGLYSGFTWGARTRILIFVIGWGLAIPLIYRGVALIFGLPE